MADSRCALVNGANGWGVFNKWIASSLNLLGDPEMPVMKQRGKVQSPRAQDQSRGRRCPAGFSAIHHEPRLTAAQMTYTAAL